MMSASSESSIIALCLGHLVGEGLTPDEAARARYLTLDKLVDIRTRFWQSYDRGLLKGALSARAVTVQGQSSGTT